MGDPQHTGTPRKEGPAALPPPILLQDCVDDIVVWTAASPALAMKLRAVNRDWGLSVESVFRRIHNERTQATACSLGDAFAKALGWEEYETMIQQARMALLLQRELRVVRANLEFVEYYGVLNGPQLARIVTPLPGGGTSAATLPGTWAITDLNLSFCNVTNDAALATIAEHLPQIQSLSVSGCPEVTDLRPFGDRLVKLGAMKCGVGDVGLSAAHNLRHLDVGDNPNVTTAAPFAEALTELDARGTCGITDAGLATCRKLRKLSVPRNDLVTTVEPFAAALVELGAFGTCGIGDQGLLNATRLEKLVASDNKRITSVSPFAESLTHLDIQGKHSGIGDEALREAHHLVTLVAAGNPRVTTLEPFADTITELYAGTECGLTDEAIRPVIGQLRGFNSYSNRKITLELKRPKW